MYTEQKKIILSISLLVSNSRETIRNCMESLRPILKQIPSELIIVNTGGTDGAIEIAKEYADEVVPFVWCSDFAKARNAGLERARGEWFLYLDDDEWFENTQPIVDFFSTGEYKKYNSASYEVRNYLNKEGTKWSSVRIYRMVKREKDTRFVSPIHEMLFPILLPEKILPVYVHHYGYAFDTEQEKKAYSERNRIILEKALKDNPKDYRLWLQMVQEYCGSYEFKEGLELALEVIRKMEQEDNWNAGNSKIAGWMIANVVSLYKLTGDNLKAYDYGKKVLELPYINEVAKINLYFRMIVVCRDLDKFEECLEYVLKYEESYKVLAYDDAKRRSETILDLEEVINEKTLAGIYVQGIKACYFLRDDKIRVFLEKLLCVEAFDMTYEEIKLFLEIIINENQMIQSNRMIEYLQGNKENEQKMMEIVEAYLRAAPQLLVAVKTILEVIQLTGMDIIPLMEEKGLEEWREECYLFASDSTKEELQMVLELLKMGNRDSFKITYLKKYCFEELMQGKGLQDNTYEMLRDYLTEYCEAVRSFYGRLYKEETFYNELNVFLPKCCQFIVKIEPIIKGELPELECAKLLKEAVEVYPEMSEFCKAYVLRMKDKMSPKTKAEDEFTKLGNIIKEKVRMFIAQRDYAAAKQTLLRLEKIMPNDREITALKEELLKL